MFTLTVCNHKGGTGKTTTSINLSAALSLSGKRVLVIDLDPQGFLTRMMGLGEPEPDQSSLVLFQQDINKPPPIQRLTAFDIIPSSPALSAAMRKLNQPTDVLWVKEYLQAAVHGYDVVLLDTAAAVTVYSLNALVASQAVIIPVAPEYQPVVGAEQTWHTVQMVRKKLNPGLREERFLFTMVDGRKKNHRAYREYMRGKYGQIVLQPIVRTCTTLSVSARNGTTVFDTDATARGAVDYANVADAIIGMMGPQEAELIGDGSSGVTDRESRFRAATTPTR
ncbi:MAG: ParA family protein [Bacteroidetes bacterium]|nr:ParA family protein [Bacteroidota bacterium]